MPDSPAPLTDSHAGAARARERRRARRTAEPPSLPLSWPDRGRRSAAGAASPPERSAERRRPEPAPPAPPTHPVIVDDGVLTQAELNFLVEAAIQRWIEAGATPEQVAEMRTTAIEVADMAGLYLGSSEPDRILIDSDGAGHGWFLDKTPGGNEEYDGTGTRLTANSGGPAAGGMTSSPC